MSESYSDALVFFGATGDLAYKKIFPSLQALLKRGRLSVPVIGVAKSGWTTDQLRARARDSVEKHGGIDPAARWMLTSGCWETPWKETPPCLPARTMWRRRGALSIPC
jgi:glucose-6-phosphate 1-dehydrogenase